MSASFTPGGVPDGARRRTQASTRLLHEWSVLQPWDAPPIYELRLGPTPLSANAPNITPAVERMLRVFNRYADMVGITPREIQVIEAKMVLDPGAVSQLQHYLDLVHTTPLVQQYFPRVVNDQIVAQRAQSVGLSVEVYSPPWTQDYLNLKYFRRQRILPSGT